MGLEMIGRRRSLSDVRHHCPSGTTVPPRLPPPHDMVGPDPREQGAWAVLAPLIEGLRRAFTHARCRPTPPAAGGRRLPRSPQPVAGRGESPAPLRSAPLTPGAGGRAAPSHVPPPPPQPGCSRWLLSPGRPRCRRLPAAPPPASPGEERSQGGRGVRGTRLPLRPTVALRGRGGHLAEGRRGPGWLGSGAAPGWWGGCPSLCCRLSRALGGSSWAPWSLAASSWAVAG